MNNQITAPTEVIRLLNDAEIELPLIPDGDSWEIVARTEKWGDEDRQESIEVLFLQLHQGAASPEELFLGEFGTFNANMILIVANLLWENINKDKENS